MGDFRKRRRSVPSYWYVDDIILFFSVHSLSLVLKEARNAEITDVQFPLLFCCCCFFPFSSSYFPVTKFAYLGKQMLILNFEEQHV